MPSQVAFRTLVLAALLALAACAPMQHSEAPAEPQAEPQAEQRPFVVVSPEGNREDPWYWLRDDEREDPDVIAYLEAENAWYEAYESRYAGLVDTLFEEIVGRIKQDDATVPVFDNGYWYYARYEEGKQYPIHARRQGSMDAPEEILLDGNAMAEGHAFFGLGSYEVSDDNRLLAWTEDTVGRRQYVLKVRDLATGELLTTGIEPVSSFTWAGDSRTLFYVENHPVTLLSYRVRRHELGAAGEDPVVYEEADTSFYTYVGRSRSRDYLAIYLSSTEATEVRILAADDPAGEFRLFLPRERGHLYLPDHQGDRWIVRTNKDAPNYRLMSVPVGAESDFSEWTDVVPHSEDVFIQSFLVFDTFLAIGERSDGLLRVRVRNWDGEEQYLPADQVPSTTWLSGNGNPRLDTTVLRYAYTSMTTPTTIYDIDVVTGARTMLKRDPVLGDFDPANYATERTWAQARDGEKIPVSLVYRKGFLPDGTAPLYQYAYGSYGSSSDPRFSSVRLSLLDRGFVFAIAHIRGGQEMGRHWYDDGRLLNKMNTFTDFVDVTRHLVREGYAAPDKVFAMGGSAGGLLMGTVANLAPDLYAGMVAHVPFVDVVTTMLDESIPLTTNEFDEWGNPSFAPWYQYMLSYSPYDNVRAQHYPPLMVTTGLYDSQVQYWEPAKWVAKLRAYRTNDAPLIFRTTMEAGHGGRSGRFERLRETAQEYAFIIDLAGIRE
ncbi:S9 family peptidase [Thioalkalivibrio sp. XN8]|uniref:S9 family peptidase n=1 Tax=Thioalkalivibrio sp. XN8 TaxID=2712863 RepID=UPI00197DCAA8|nr:S9 family peptidase [Thioalkalivibrio sp. XN8]